MKTFENQMWTECSQKSPWEEMRTRIKHLIYGLDETIEEDDRYELESCRTLTYKEVVDWLIKNKPSDFDEALLYRYKSERNIIYPIVLSIVFVKDSKPLLGRNYLKKIYYCSFLDVDLDKLFAGEDKVLVK